MSLFTLRQNDEHKRGWLSPNKDIFHSFAEGESELAAKIVIYEFYHELKKSDPEKYLKKLGWSIQKNDPPIFITPMLSYPRFAPISDRFKHSIRQLLRLKK